MVRFRNPLESATEAWFCPDGSWPHKSSGKEKAIADYDITIFGPDQHRSRTVGLVHVGRTRRKAQTRQCQFHLESASLSPHLYHAVGRASRALRETDRVCRLSPLASCAIVRTPAVQPLAGSAKKGQTPKVEIMCQGECPNDKNRVCSARALALAPAQTLCMFHWTQGRTTRSSQRCSRRTACRSRTSKWI